MKEELVEGTIQLIICTFGLSILFVIFRREAIERKRESPHGDVIDASLY